MLRATYPVPALAVVHATCEFIPPITDPMGRHWDQPKDMCEVEFDATHALLTKRQFDDLAEYSTTNPSGVYPGKCWKAQGLSWPERHGGFPKPTGKWFLRWFGMDETWPKYCTNNQREIIITD